jgi:hypothetical protein
MILFKRKVLLVGLNYGLPILLLSGIWFPVLYHYYVPGINVTNEIIDRARQSPSDKTFEAIKYFFGSNKKNEPKLLINKAEEIMSGKISAPGDPSKKIRLPVDLNEINNLNHSLLYQLFILNLPRILIDAYETTRSDDFLMTARDMIMDFAFYEKTKRLPKGLLWNDGVVAQRIAVLAKFWKFYRNHPDYELEVGRELFQLIARSAQLLAKSGHFNFATNHGIMQNLALWQISLAFPSLPNVDFYKKIALKRMRDQMHFYIDKEGVVLEHSTGYQNAGMRFLDLGIRYATMLDLQIPDDWHLKYSKAKKFYAQIIRPDGSLPMFGDTGSGEMRFEKIVENQNGNEKEEGRSWDQSWNIKQPQSLYPVAGYSIWWAGLDKWPKKKMNQTAVAWSYFPGHAHKHADEMSVLIWAEGHNWWTNVGYWPYKTKGRSDAVSWAGSNAPHLINESYKSARHTRLMSYAWSESDSLAFIDLERKGPENYIAHRQVVQVNRTLWIVLDHTLGTESQRTTTTWTTSSNINLSKGELPGSYLLEPNCSNVKLLKFIITSEGAKIRQFKGSFSPFAGWESHRPAPAIVIEQPASNSWAVSIWLLQESIGNSCKFSCTPPMIEWTSPYDWNIVVEQSTKEVKIIRKNDYIFLKRNAKGPGIQKKVHLRKAPHIADELIELQTAYENAARKYPRTNYRIYRHRKATYLVLLIFILQEAFFLIYRKIEWKYFDLLRGLAFFCWVALSVCIIGIYL